MKRASAILIGLSLLTGFAQSQAQTEATTEPVEHTRPFPVLHTYDLGTFELTGQIASINPIPVDSHVDNRPVVVQEESTAGGSSKTWLFVVGGAIVVGAAAAIIISQGDDSKGSALVFPGFPDDIE